MADGEERVRLSAGARQRRANGDTVYSVTVQLDEVADAIQAVEEEGWRLDHVSAYSYAYGGGAYYPTVATMALLVFRKNNF